MQHLVECRHPTVWRLIEALQADTAEASSRVVRHALNQLTPKKQSKSVKNMQRRLQGLCNKLTAGDSDADSLSLEQFLNAVGYNIRFHCD